MWWGLGLLILFWYLCHGHEMLHVGYQCFIASSNNTYLFQMHVWFFILEFIGTIMEENNTWFRGLEG